MIPKYIDDYQTYSDLYDLYCHHVFCIMALDHQLDCVNHILWDLIGF